jgi:hypothetical protein
MPPFWTVGCLYGATSVAIGAFGAHGLKKRIADPQRITNWSTAAQYQVRLRSLPPPFFSLLPLLMHYCSSYTPLS